MRAVLSELGIAVLDGFLDTADLERVRRGLVDLPYRRVDNRAPSSAWSMAEELPRESVSFYNDSAFDARDPRQAALAFFAERLEASLGEFHALLGITAGEEVRFNLRSWLYARSAGLSWHRDAGRTGAYTYYFHETWSPRWGGELLVAEPDAEDFDPGRCFQPRPNRLVVIRSGTPHRIALVSPAAGEHARLSLSGFFYREGDDEFMDGRGKASG